MCWRMPKRRQGDALGQTCPVLMMCWRMPKRRQGDAPRQTCPVLMMCWRMPKRRQGDAPRQTCPVLMMCWRMPKRHQGDAPRQTTTVLIVSEPCPRRSTCWQSTTFQMAAKNLSGNECDTMSDGICWAAFPESTCRIPLRLSPSSGFFPYSISNSPKHRSWHAEMLKTCLISIDCVTRLGDFLP